jgi:hypothetical protein
VSDDNQIVIPPSFIALFVPPGRSRPNAGHAEISARYEFCEDLANLLTETASLTLWQLGITEADVLQRVQRGLLTPESGVSAAEAQWVLQRLAELLGWAAPLAAGPVADQSAAKQ